MADQTKYSNKLQNARILVIGGSSGIGYGVAEACIEYGALVVISSSNSSRVHGSVDKIKKAYPSKTSNIHGLTVDLSKPETLEQELDKLFKGTVQKIGENGKIDHVIFTAGDSLSTMSIEEMTVEKITKAGQIRFFAPLLTAKFVKKYLVSAYTSSYTITTGGISERPQPHWSVIGSYAGGHHSMVRNLALDLKPIRVNGVSPGAVDTDLWKNMSEEQKQGFFKAVEQHMATGRVGQVDDVVESFLAILKDGNMDGDVIRTNGGGLFM